MVFITVVAVAVGLWYIIALRTVKRNKYEVHDFVYIKTIGGLLLARIDSITWESSVPHLIGGPTYDLYYVDAEKHACLPESAILCKFKGERLVLNE